MPTPDFVLSLRERVGHAPLWLSGATAVVLRQSPEGEQVLLVRDAESGHWGPVSGIIDPGEEPHLAALREVAEEAGVVAVAERLAWVSVTPMISYSNGDQSQYLDHTFRCRWVAGEPYPADGEASEARFFALDSLPPMPPRQAHRVAVVLENRPEARFGPLEGRD